MNACSCDSVYLNDILIYFKNEENHEKHIKKVLKKFQEKNFYFKSEKYEFHKQQIEYLEYIVTMKELEMNLKKIKAIIKFSTSECIKNIQAFQELTKYYQKFIINFISIIASLTDLLWKNKSFKWAKSQKWVFQKIKKKFKKKLILIYFDYEKSVIINANTSERIMKAQLQQIND